MLQHPTEEEIAAAQRASQRASARARAHVGAEASVADPEPQPSSWGQRLFALVPVLVVAGIVVMTLGMVRPGAASSTS